MKTREEIKKLKQGSKKYWSKSNEILGQEAKVCSIPGLKNVAGEWVHDPGEKADLFAETFAKKCVLAEREDNRYTNLERSDKLAIFKA